MPRTFTSAERAAVQASRLACRTKFEMTDSDGNWRDVSTSLDAPDWFNEATLSESIDSNTVALNATLLRDTGTLSLAPLRTDSTINRNTSAAYAPMLNVRRRWRISTSVTGPTDAPAWKELQSGYIDRIQVDGDTPTIPVTGRGMEAAILDTQITVVRSYCTGGALPVETVIQQLLDDNMGTGADATLGGLATQYSSGITLYTPTYSPTFYINQGYRPAVGNLMDAVTQLAQLAGMVVRYRYDASDVNRFTLLRPNRTQTVPDWSIGATEYTSIPVNALDITGVRTWIDLYYVDASLGQQHVTSPSSGTSDALTLYGKRYMRVDVAGSVTLDATNAQAMADAMRSDLELPALEQQIVSPGLWFVQLYDYGQFLANGVHYNEDQYGGVTGIAHAMTNGTIRSTVSVRGKPAGRYRTWLKYATQPVIGLAYNQCVAKVTATSATTITVTVTASAPSGTPTVTLTSITGSAALSSGPALGTASASGTVWVFTRGAALGGSGQVQFTADFAGNVSDTDLVAIPEQGRDTTYLASRARVIASDATSVTVRYAVADPYPQGSGSVTLAYQALNTGTVSPASGSPVTPNATITENAGTYVDYTITRPAFGTGTGRVTFTASAANRVSDSDAVDIPAQEKTAFGPNLQVSGVQSGTNYVITWSGDSVQLSIDGGAFGAPPASPITVAMNAPGGVAKTYTFTGLKDGQTVSNTVTVPAQSGSTAPSLSLTPFVTSNQVDDTTTPVTLTMGASNLPGTYTWTLFTGYSKANCTTVAASGSNSSTPLSGSPTQSVTPAVKLPKWYFLRVTVGSDNYDSAPIIVNARLSFFNTSGVPIRGTPFTDGGYPATATTSDGYGLAGGAYDSRGYAINTHFNTAHHTLDNVPMTGTYGAPLNTRLNAGRPVVDFSESIHANKTTDYITDGTGSPLTGGARAAAVLDGNGRFNDVRSNRALTISGPSATYSQFSAGGYAKIDPVSASGLNMTIAAHDLLGGFRTAYPAGSTTGTAYNQANYVYADDPGLTNANGGTYLNTTDDKDVIWAATDVYFVGQKILVSGAAGTDPTQPPPSCPAPETPIQYADGRRGTAGDLVVGDAIQSYDPVAHALTECVVTGAVLVHAPRRVRIMLEDGRTLTASPEHPLYDLVRGDFTPIVTLRPGDYLGGDAPARVVAVEEAGPGPVVRVSVTGAHTYLTHGLLSHNTKTLMQ